MLASPWFRCFDPWESFSYKIHIWFWSKLVITLVRVRAFLSMTNANTNSVRAGQRSFSENNFLQFKLRLVDPRYMRVLYNLSHHPSCQIPLSAVFVLNSNSASVPSFLTFDWGRFEPRQVIGIFRFFWADYSSLVCLSGSDYFWLSDYQMVSCSQDCLSLFSFFLVTIMLLFHKWFQC